MNGILYYSRLRDCVTIRLERQSGPTERSEVPVLRSSYATEGGRSVVRQAHHPEQRRTGIQEKGIISEACGSWRAPRFTGLGRDDEL
jgi:hypothetical protein